jgi:hypothetical protein
MVLLSREETTAVGLFHARTRDPDVVYSVRSLTFNSEFDSG